MIKVCKFGGTSMADAKAIRQVKSIIESDASRKYVVVSAPGKRFKEDIKITDTLYKCYSEVVETGSCKNSFDVIRASMEGVAFEIAEIVRLYTSSKICADKIILSGGATRSKVWMKILSTVLNRDLYISNQADRCCFGAYSIARKADLGKFTVFPFDGVIVSPDKELVDFYDKKRLLYNRAFE